MSNIKIIGCMILGTLIGITVGLLLDLPDDKGWIVGLICIGYTIGLILLYWKEGEQTNEHNNH